MLKLGTQNIPALYLGNQEIKRAYLGERLVFEGGKPSRLPEGYTEVEYVHTVAAAKFDTGFTVNSLSDCIKMDISPAAQTSTSAYYICDAISGSYNLYALYYKYSSSSTNQSMQIKANAASSAAFTFSRANFNKIRRWVIIDFLNKKIDPGINGIATNSGISNTTSRNFTNFHLGCSPKRTYNSMIGDWYSCQIFRNNVLALDLVPCIDPSGAVGFYDLVSKKFIGNTGSGTVTAGPAV